MRNALPPQPRASFHPDAGLFVPKSLSSLRFSVTWSLEIRGEDQRDANASPSSEEAVRRGEQGFQELAVMSCFMFPPLHPRKISSDGALL